MKRSKCTNTVAFWGAGATAKLGIATTAAQNKVFLALSLKEPKMSYRDCLQKAHDVFGDCLDEVCDLLTLLDDDVGDDTDNYAYGYRMSGFSQRQIDIINCHANDLGDDDEKRRNRVIMLRLRYDWAAVMRVLRLQKYNVDENGEPSETFTQAIYNLLDANITDGKGIHVFDDKYSVLSNFLDPMRLRHAKAALVMFVNLMFATSWAKNRVGKELERYLLFGKFLADIRAKEARDTIRDGVVESVFKTSFVSMNFDPALWWILKNADSEYNKSPIYVGKDNAPLYLGEDVDQVDAVRPFKDKSAAVNLADGILPECVAKFVNERGDSTNERCFARYQTVKIFFPHGSPNLKICPCCGKTTLYQGDKLLASSASLYPPFFFKKLTWGCQPAEALHGTNDSYAEKKKWDEGELDNIQCRHCGRSIRMCDTEMVMQSGLKTPPSYLLQRISHNVDDAVMRANHIVLMGYSLPPDDGAGVAELQARTTREGGGGKVYCSVVGFVKGATNRWLYADELDAFIKDHHDDNAINPILNARRIFGRDLVRANMVGIPDVLEKGDSIREMLYPSTWR